MKKQTKNKNILYVVVGLVVVAVFMFIFSDEKKASDDIVVYDQYQSNSGPVNKEPIVKKEEQKEEKIKPDPDPYVEPSIKVLSPNGGEEKIALNGVKNTYTIKWKTTGFSSNDTVNIALKDNSVNCIATMTGCQYSFIIASVPNTGSFVWNLNEKMSGPSTGPNSVLLYPGERFKITVTAIANNNGTGIPFALTDESDGEFKIYSCPFNILPPPGWCYMGKIINPRPDPSGCFVSPICEPFSNTQSAQ